MSNMKVTAAERDLIEQIRNMNMETVMTRPVVITDMKKKASDILLAISWRELANSYFHKSSSWLYHKMDGIDGNGGKGGFTPEEAEQLRGALVDLSNRASSKHNFIN